MMAIAECGLRIAELAQTETLCAARGIRNPQSAIRNGVFRNPKSEIRNRRHEVTP